MEFRGIAKEVVRELVELTSHTQPNGGASSAARGHGAVGPTTASRHRRTPSGLSKVEILARSRAAAADRGQLLGGANRCRARRRRRIDDETKVHLTARLCH